MSDLETRLRAIGELLPDPDERATEAGRRAMHDARASAPWATGRRRSWFASRGPRTYLIAAALALAVGGGALAAGGWGISDLPPFGDDDRSAFVLPATDILPGGYERTRPPTYADLPERPSLLFPAGVGYTEALARYSAARQAGRILPEGVELTDPLPAGKVVMVRSDGRVALDPAAPFGYSATTGLVTTLSALFDGRAIPIARCQLLIGADDPASPACDQAGVRRAYVREGVAGRWVPSPNEEAVFDRLTPASTELSVIDRPTTPLVRLPSTLPLAEPGSGAAAPRVGRLALETPDVRLIVVPVEPDRLCFIAQERAGGAGFSCGPRATFLNRGASLSGGRYMNGPYRLNGLVGDGIDRVSTDDGTVVRVTNNAFTMLPKPTARVLTFNGPVGSFRIAVPRFGDGGPPRLTPDRSKQRELLGVDLADGGRASIRVAPNRGGGRCVWVYVKKNSRSFACSRPGDSPSLPDDQVTGSFIRRIDRIPSLFQGQFSSRVGSVEIAYADGTATRLRPTEGYVLYEVPAAHMTKERRAVSVTTFDQQGVALVREEVRRPGSLRP
ncbi:hypothetical protein [Miltoncostaea oceani]|uniref:hypothetical protein n=1 Tax=Miltoncostaea oceani TaxID=2843216 RepID=UPI001C3D0F54|nr:hypothetical protein [Miltoncostaea oceani]